MVCREIDDPLMEYFFSASEIVLRSPKVTCDAGEMFKLGVSKVSTNPAFKTHVNLFVEL